MGINKKRGGRGLFMNVNSVKSCYAFNYVLSCTTLIKLNMLKSVGKVDVFIMLNECKLGFKIMV